MSFTSIKRTQERRSQIIGEKRGYSRVKNEDDWKIQLEKVVKKERGVKNNIDTSGSYTMSVEEDICDGFKKN